VADATSVSWSFPGGIPAVSTLTNPRVTYSQPGNYNVTLTAVKPNGTFTTRVDTLVKIVQPPKASFDITVKSDTIIITNKSLNSQSYKWDFGDGTGSTLENPKPHIYNRNGNYVITLLAENEFCGSATSRQIPVFFTAVKDLTTEGGVIVNPNPTNGVLNLYFKDVPTVDYDLTLFRPDGLLVKSFKLNRSDSQLININDLSSGVYILQFTHDKVRFVRKVVKM
jgi:hypothetical protein